MIVDLWTTASATRESARLSGVFDGPVVRARTSWTARAAVARTGPHQSAVGYALAHGFVLSLQEALDLDVEHPALRRMLRAGVWSRPRHGWVAVTALDRETRPTLEAVAAARAWSRSAVCGISAVAVHGLPVLSAPARPELIGPMTTGRRSVLISDAPLESTEITTWCGIPVTAVSRTLVDVGRTDRRQCLVAADAALAEKLTTKDEIREVLERCANWPGVSSARTVLGLADAAAESPLESLTRLCLSDAGLPPPELQVTIRDPEDGWHCRVDFLWRGRRLVLEADGRLKYTDDALWQEKLRQERLEQLGFRVIRVTWSDVLRDPTRTVARVRRALES